MKRLNSCDAECNLTEVKPSHCSSFNVVMNRTLRDLLDALIHTLSYLAFPFVTFFLTSHILLTDNHSTHQWVSVVLTGVWEQTVPQLPW